MCEKKERWALDVDMFGGRYQDCPCLYCEDYVNYECTRVDVQDSPELSIEEFEQARIEQRIAELEDTRMR